MFDSLKRSISQCSCFINNASFREIYIIHRDLVLFIDWFPDMISVLSHKDITWECCQYKNTGLAAKLVSEEDHPKVKRGVIQNLRIRLNS